MSSLTGVCAELSEDEVICFLAERYHTTPCKIVKYFLAHEEMASDCGNITAEFTLDDNEIELMRDLTDKAKTKMRC